MKIVKKLKRKLDHIVQDRGMGWYLRGLHIDWGYYKNRNLITYTATGMTVTSVEGTWTFKRIGG